LNLLDIVIVNYNSTDHLLRCLRSVYDSLYGLPAEIFVQDNASKDNIDRVTSMFPEVKLSKNIHNVGFAKAVNNALKQGSAPYVVLLNPDTYVGGDFIKSAVRHMEENPDVGILGPKILNEDGSVQGSARRFPTLLTSLFGRNTLLTKIFPNNRISRANILTTSSDGISAMELDWVSGACMVVRRNALIDVGYLDERFFMYWEDADWCRRMWRKGWKVVYFPKTFVIHYVGVSSEKNILRSIFEFHKSSYWLFNKYNKPSLWSLKPLVITGLSLRLPFALTSNGIRVFCERRAILKKPKKEALFEGMEERIKVMRLIARMNIGGPAIHVHLLAKGLDEKKFKSILVTGKISPQEGDMSYLFKPMETKPIIIHELQREISIMMDIKAFFQIFKILRREMPDIVHTHTAKAGTSARIAAVMYNIICRQNVRMVHTFHGHVFEGYFSRAKSLLFVWIERLLAKSTDVVIAISETQKKELAEKFRIAAPAKIKTIELGFDLNPFLKSRALRGHFRKNLGLDNNTLLIGIIGRLVPIKNHIMFLKAAEAFLEQNPDVRVKFIVVGDGELRGELEGYCNRNGLSRYVRFCGWIRNVSEVYSDLDILALTSINEGTPVSIIEAMACSVPVIATDAGGVLDLLGPRDGVPSSDGFVVCERGIFCRKNDVLGFARGLKYLVGVDKYKNEKRLMRARSFVKYKFSQEHLIKDIEALYLDLMGKHEQNGNACF